MSGIVDVWFSLIVNLKNYNNVYDIKNEIYKYNIDNDTNGYWILNLLTNEIVYSDRFISFLGYSKEEFPNKISSLEKITPYEDFHIMQERISKCIESNGAIKYVNPTRCIKKNGEIANVVGYAKIVSWDENDKPKIMIGMRLDTILNVSTNIKNSFKKII